MDWIVKQAQSLFKALSEIFTADIFLLGGQKITIFLLIEIIFFTLIAWLIVRVIKEWVKRWLLVRFGFDRGSREAISSVTGYILAIFGFLIVLQKVGFDLSSLTVIAGAIGIGVGFAFKNLVSNFISGITLLFEQPIKVGDLVEVGDILGTVEKISIRSTVIRNLTGVFIIVPNFRFIENEIVNWSYQDSRSGINIPITIAYGSDTVLVTEALLAAARKEPQVLSYPSPKVLFTGFGDNALEFKLLVWINNPREQFLIISSLNFLIEAELRYRSIQIPFPQRDLHIQNPEALAGLWQQNISTEITKDKVPIQSSSLPTRKKPISKPFNNWTLRDLLRQVSYFEKCSTVQLRQLIEEGYRQVFPPGEMICRENDPGDAFYIILSGSVEVFSEQTGKYIVTRSAGEFFGEMSLLMGIPRTASIRSLEETILFVVDRYNLQNLLVKHQGLADRICEELSQRQESLRSLGLLTNEIAAEPNPLIWIRQRIKTLFEL
ncbi:small-conductance mechanosensitive channel [Xenococcus sp. PCC 7305]|uniref:mechanosensitive ion channel domain-containing protein n=1 Tax=Xenococcus sp. PCC 7305 TaxID=102125 RepID=UPI0002AB9BBC|nr:mechanosensitive ion channel domain-containing protein [Xenococcus sp. PCC 7305]ELS01921.1 small-conductance mechanosensitive channel [Xenococcus sp. PCC 7305]